MYKTISIRAIDIAIVLDELEAKKLKNTETYLLLKREFDDFKAHQKKQLKQKLNKGAR